MNKKVRSGNVKVVVEKAKKSGDLLVAVEFSGEDKNFCVEDLKWWPKLDELNVLEKARKLVMEKQSRKKDEAGDSPF
jgi:hypothetical protein